MHKQFAVLVGILFILALLVAGSVHGAPSGNIIYVKHDATGSNDGSSWNDAYKDLQDALGVAQAGDEIWVAQGVYYPAATASDRAATFQLQDGVALYGGFIGVETERSQRDWQANVTVLSGDLDRNDSTDKRGVVTTVDGITGRNSYHVVVAVGLGKNTVLDGFVVTAGHANTGTEIGGGMVNWRYSDPTLTNLIFSGNYAADKGGGVYNAHYSNATLTNVTFSGNAAKEGGGMYNEQSSPTLTNVTFSANEGPHVGGGMMNDYGNPTLTNVTFTGNRCEWYFGGGMFNYHGDPRLTNVTFTGNQCEQQWGGGMAIIYGNPTLINVTFSGNQAGWSGGGLYNLYGRPTLVNCILWANGPNGFLNEAGSAIISYSDVQNSGGSDNWDSALGTDGGHNIDADPLFVDPVSADEAPTTDGDYRLTAASPATDGGTNYFVTVDTDLDGNPRILDGTGDGNAVVDMGAYELRIPLLTIIRQAHGVVISTPGSINCGSACTARFPPSTPVTLTANANTGWTFECWRGDVPSTENPLEFTIEGDTVISATFTRAEYTLDVTIIGEGDVDVEPDQDTYLYGDDVILTATANPGWTFVGWSGDIESTDNPLELTIQDDTRITATFTQDEYTLDVTIVGEGEVDIDPEQDTYHHGDVVTLTATAHPGWTFAAWSGDVESTDNPLDFVVEGDTVITATFTEEYKRVYLPLVLANQ